MLTFASARLSCLLIYGQILVHAFMFTHEYTYAYLYTVTGISGKVREFDEDWKLSTLIVVAVRDCYFDISAAGSHGLSCNVDVVRAWQHCQLVLVLSVH